MATDCISLEAAIKEHCLSCFSYSVCNEELRNQCPDIKALIEIPTADVVEVVRCRDCVDCVDGFVCKNGQFRGRTFPNNFCSDGERRSDNG